MIFIQNSKFNKLAKEQNFYFKSISSLLMGEKVNRPFGDYQNIKDQHGVDVKNPG